MATADEERGGGGGGTRWRRWRSARATPRVARPVVPSLARTAETETVSAAGVNRPGTVPRGNREESGPKPPRDGLSKTQRRWPVEKFRVGFHRGEKAGFPAGTLLPKWP